jgi:hypothetical protein
VVPADKDCHHWSHLFPAHILVEGV